jgi:hypothetical protein
MTHEEIRKKQKLIDSLDPETVPYEILEALWEIALQLQIANQRPSA